MTLDGGAHWTIRSVPAPPGTSGAAIDQVSCPTVQRCVAHLDDHGSGTFVSTINGGRIYQWSCANGLHCMLLTTSRRIAITTTSDGGATWRTTAAPPSWPNTSIDVSCATGLDCFISAPDWVSTVRSATGNGAYLHPVIEATYDGGSTWTSLTVPRAGKFPLALVFPLSCPSLAGCIGVAATTEQQEGISSRREIISSFPSSG